MIQVSPIPTLSDTSVPAYSLGSNWRIQFIDADGIPLNMLSFEVIDFGAISYREIFQNVKTILATPIMSAALERLLGVDSRVVDLPINKAQEAIIAIHEALYRWEPRVEVMNIEFSPDVLVGKLGCKLQLKMKNVFYGTDKQYSQANVFDSPMKVDQSLPPMQEPVLIPGPKGDTGTRGSKWFTGTSDPDPNTIPEDVLAGDMFLNTSTGDVFQYEAETNGGVGLRPRKKPSQKVRPRPVFRRK